MKTFISKMRQHYARRIVIFGLLAGLFFSGGEGIRLLPFPVSARDNSEINVSVREENSKSYAFSVFSARSCSALLKAKFQKDSNQYLSGAHFACERIEAGTKNLRQSAQNRSRADFPRSSPIAGSNSKRGPPAAA